MGLVFCQAKGMSMWRKWNRPLWWIWILHLILQWHCVDPKDPCGSTENFVLLMMNSVGMVVVFVSLKEHNAIMHLCQMRYDRYVRKNFHRCMTKSIMPQYIILIWTRVCMQAVALLHLDSQWWISLFLVSCSNFRSWNEEASNVYSPSIILPTATTLLVHWSWKIQWVGKRWQ